MLKSHLMQEETIKIFFKDRVEETMTSLSYQFKKAPQLPITRLYGNMWHLVALEKTLWEWLQNQ